MGCGGEEEEDEGFEQLSPGDEEWEEGDYAEEGEEEGEEETRWDLATAAVAARGEGGGAMRAPWRWNAGNADILSGRGGKYVAAMSPAKTAGNGGSDGAGVSSHWSSQRNQKSAASAAETGVERRNGNNGSNLRK